MIKKKIETLKGVFFDFDGVFTNNKVLVSQNGEESVLCDRSDGIGLSKLRDLGLYLAICSTEKNPVVQKRAEKLKIDCIHGCENKLEVIRHVAKQKLINLNEVAFVGNDVNDLDCLSNVGLPVCVADAYPEVKKISAIVLKRKGGYGAVREFCDLVYNIKNRRQNK